MQREKNEDDRRRKKRKSQREITEDKFRKLEETVETEKPEDELNQREIIEEEHRRSEEEERLEKLREEDGFLSIEDALSRFNPPAESFRQLLSSWQPATAPISQELCEVGLSL